MTRIRPIWLLLALFLVLSHLQASASRLKTPVEISPTRRGITRVSLYVRARPISIPLQKPFEGLTFSYTGRFYQMGSTDEHPPMLPGPIIHVVPGGKVRLQLFNCLGAEDVTSGGSMFSFHDPNTTNIHFHGSHSDPEVDNPFVTAAPGGNLSYKLSIPRGHEPGMHWYHAHSHGSVYYQVMSGLFGAFVVDDGKTLKSPKHPFTDVPSHVLLMHLYRLGPGGCDGMTMNQANGHLPFQPRIHDESGTEHPLPSNLLLVNGQHTPTVPIRQYHDTVLRIGFAAGSCHANLTLPSTCSFHVFAIDGVQLRHTVPRSWLYFTTATRMELVVVCQEDGKFPVIWNHPDSTNSVAFFLGVKAAQEPTSSLTFPAALPRYKPDYLLMSAANYVHWEISMSQRDLPSPKPYYILGQGPDCSLLQNSSTCLYDHFQGELGTNPEKYDGFVIPLNSVVIARVYGDPTDPIPHPLHFHVNHFQVLSFTPRPGGQHANHTLEMYGVHRHEFRDTVPILDGVTTIRWRAATFSGEVVYHCHALHHEDRGMMRSYLVLPHPNRGDERDNVPSPTAPPKPPAFPLFWVFFTLVLAGIVWLALRLCRKLQSLRTSSATTYPNEGTSLLPQ